MTLRSTGLAALTTWNTDNKQGYTTLQINIAIQLSILQVPGSNFDPKIGYVYRDLGIIR